MGAGWPGRGRRELRAIQFGEPIERCAERDSSPTGDLAMSQHVGNNTQSNEKGEDGFVQLIPNLHLASSTQPPAQAVAAVPVNSPIALVLMSTGLGALALGIRRRQQK